MITFRAVKEGKDTSLEEFGVNSETISKLDELIRSFNELVSIDSSIEVVCVEKNRLGYEMKVDNRIQTDSPHFIMELYNSKAGAKVPKRLLKESYKDINICFCVFQNLSDIFNIFHEVSHFYNQPFDNEIDDLTQLNDFEYLRYQIRRVLNEYCANYNMFKFLFDNDKSWIGALESHSIDYLFRIRSFDKNQIGKISNRSLMFLFFENEFKFLFYCLGIWRGFYDFKIQPPIVPFDIHLKSLYRRMGLDEKHILFLDSLKQELLKPHDCRNLETFAKDLYTQFNIFFEHYFTIKDLKTS